MLLKKFLMLLRAPLLGSEVSGYEYHAAREKQRQVDYRIQKIEDRISKAQVIDVLTINQHRIVFGAFVTLYDEDRQQRFSL